MEDQKLRTERLWRKVKDWITEVSGAASEAYLPSIPSADLVNGLHQLAGQTSNFRITALKGGEAGQAEDIPLTGLESIISLLQEGTIDGLTINFTAPLAAFDLDVHSVINPRWDGSFGVELVWWSDQVFPDDTDAFERFQMLIAYLATLKEMFHAQGLFIGPENLEKPGAEAINWIEV